MTDSKLSQGLHTNQPIGFIITGDYLLEREIGARDCATSHTGTVPPLILAYTTHMPAYTHACSHSCRLCVYVYYNMYSAYRQRTYAYAYMYESSTLWSSSSWCESRRNIDLEWISNTYSITNLEQIVNINLEQFYKDFLISTRKIRPVTWQTSLLMVRSLSPQDLNPFIRLFYPIKVHKDTQGYYPYKRQKYIYKGI